MRGMELGDMPAAEQSTRGNSSRLTTKPSVVVPESETCFSDVARDALQRFGLSSPDIVLTFIGGAKSFAAWKNEDHRAALQKGVIKIINAAETWILDSGLDYGLSRMIGNAVRDEHRYRRSRREYELFAKGHLLHHHHQYPVVLMGITPTAPLQFKNVSSPMDVAGGPDPIEPLAVDSSHTHFVFIEGPAGQTGARQAQMTVDLVHQASHLTRAIPISPSGSCAQHSLPAKRCREKEARHQQIPLIAVLIQGDEMSLDMVETYLQRGVPVLVVKGTGLMADIVAFAFEELRDEKKVSQNLDKVTAALKTKLARIFPRTEVDGTAAVMSEKVVTCIRLAKELPGRELLSVVASSENSLSDLDSVVLPVMFAARSAALNAVPQQISLDFLLTMKFNLPSLAKTSVFSREDALFKDEIILADNELFEKALLWMGREVFVEEFMEGDFTLHKFLNHSRLLRLFRLAENRDFFVTLLEDMLPTRSTQSEILEETLVTINLNAIVQHLTGFPNFLSMHDLSSNYFGLYAQNAYVAERQAMNALMVWAVLMNRFNLAKTLLKFCDDPIPMALFVSALFHGLMTHCDASLTTVLQEQSRAFSTMANDILEMSYRESSDRTFDLLNQKFSDFNDKTPIKMAYESENKYFLAHEACQIWLTKLWEGGIIVLSPPDALIPPEAKIILSALLLFPINFWIQYSGKEFLKHQMKADEPDIFTDEIASHETDPIALTLDNVNRHTDPFDVSSPSNSDKSQATLQKLEELSLLEARLKSGKKSDPLTLDVPVKRAVRPIARYAKRTKTLPFWRKVYYLWSAPRTKFWLFQLFYWVYLAIFSIAVLLPTCNGTHLDAVVFVWTLFSVIEVGLRTAYQARHGFPVSIRRRATEVVIITVLVLFSIVCRAYFTAVRPLYTRALMATGLLYMYYRLISVFFPMNPDLGPTLFRIKRMITVDFVAFVRLALPFILANLFVLQAVMYPDLPFSLETWRQGFHRAFFTLFTAFIGEIEYSPRCEATRIYNRSMDTCWTGDYADHTCPTLGVISYALNIQYWIIMRLIFTVLLSALFAATMIKVNQEAEYIFKYQRYTTVLDFASRAALPPPLSVVGYLFDWVVTCCIKVRKRGGDHTRLVNLTRPRSVKQMDRGNDDARSSEFYSYWMGLTKEYYRKKAREDKQKGAPVEKLTTVEFMTFDLLV